jgi:DNA modification methylase
MRINLGKTVQSDNPINDFNENQTTLEQLICSGVQESESTQVDPISGHTIKEWHAGTPIRWQLFCGQAKEVLRLIEDSSIDCVITSPPYFWLRDYKVDGQIGLEESVDGYVVAITDVMSEIYRVLKPEGTLFLNLGDTYYSGKGESQGVDKKSSKRRFGLRAVDRSGGLGIGLQRKSIIGIPWRVALKMCQQNWVLRSPIIWHRQNSLAEVVKDRPARGYEYIFLFAKSRRYYFSKDGLPQNGTAEDVWSIPARTKLNGARDTAPYPDELVERCLAVGCPPGGKVLDPFCGSGTTMRVAIKQGHPAIGIELNKDFCIYIRKELKSLAQ